MFSESNAEAYIGDLHGNMALYGWQRCGFVPAFQAVYSGKSPSQSAGACECWTHVDRSLRVLLICSSGWTVNAGVMEWPVPNKSDPTLKTWNTNKPSPLPSWMAYSALQLVYGHIPGNFTSTPPVA